jgi:soluble lytic murein transglycosylase-like protein
MADIPTWISQAAQKYNLDPAKLTAQLAYESGLDPSKVNPKSGAAGIAQFMPGTARGFGIDPMNPQQAIFAAAAYMRQNLNRFNNDYPTALAAYNWGPGNVAKYGLQAAPPETQRYVATRARRGHASSAANPFSRNPTGTPDRPAPARA